MVTDDGFICVGSTHITIFMPLPESLPEKPTPPFVYTNKEITTQNKITIRSGSILYYIFILYINHIGHTRRISNDI